MDWLNFILGLLTLLFAGVNIFQFIFLKQTKKKYEAEADKAKASVKSDEIDNMRKAMEDFYGRLVDKQNERIAQLDEKIAEKDKRIDVLEGEVTTLRSENADLKVDITTIRNENENLKAQMSMITRKLGLYPRDEKGQFAKKEGK